jgi:hypothetical protein
VLDLVGGPDRHEPVVAAVTRLLGTRLLLQGAADLVLGRRVLRPGVAVELTHAASMVGLAARGPEHRRTALVSAAVATSLAALDLHER